MNIGTTLGPGDLYQGITKIWELGYTDVVSFNNMPTLKKIFSTCDEKEAL